MIATKEQTQCNRLRCDPSDAIYGLLQRRLDDIEQAFDGPRPEFFGTCVGVMPFIREYVEELERRRKQTIDLLRAIDPKQSCNGEGAAESWQFCVEHALEVLEGRAT